MRKLFSTLGLLLTLSVSAQVSFTPNTYSGCWPLTVTFANTSSGATYFQWDFGDGQTSTTPSPTHTFTTPGQYYVYLWGYDSFGNYVGYHYEYIEVTGGAGTISINKDTVCIGDEVQFWDNASADSYAIDYGDGNSETNTWGSFYHTYSAPGMYIITYDYISTQCGTYTVQDTVWAGSNVSITDGNLQIDPTSLCPGDEFNFWTNWEYDWVIDFGDGSTANSNGNIYEHSYLNVGTYNVTVTLQNGCGNTAQISQSVSVQNNLPIDPNNANIWVYSPVCPNEDIYFSANSGYSSYYWDFGDGATSIEQYPEHAYSSFGTYNVAMTMTNGCGNDTTLYDVVTVNNSVYIDSWVEIDMPDSVCFGEPLLFDVDGGEVNTYIWNFGDGGSAYTEDGAYTYTNAGTYNVSVYLENGCGNDTTLYSTVYVGTNVGVSNDNLFYSVFPEEACPGDTVLFVAFPGGGSTAYTWDFGDGNGTSNTETVVINDEYVYAIADHAYQNAGTYNVAFTATNTCGYSLSDTIEVNVGPGAQPDPDIIFNEDAYNCLGADVEFMAVGGVEMVWDFGDGTGTLVTNGTLEPYYHTYNQPGTYTVTLTATNNCGLSSTTDVEIFIPDNSISVATSSNDAHCGDSDGLAVCSISGGDAPFSISWSNGDAGNIADSLTAGIYSVIVTDANGCIGEGVATVSDQEAPTIVLNAQVDVACAGGNDGALDVNVIGSSAPYSYAWMHGSSGQDVNNLIAGSYQLLVTDANGCVAAENFVINEPDPVIVSFTSTPSNCGQNNGTATANVSGSTGPYLYSWENGMSSQTISNLGPGVYGVNVIDNNGCLFSGQVAVSETNAPAILVDSLIQDACGGSLASIYLTPMGGTAPYNVQWSNGASTEDLTNVTSGEYDVIVTGANGCSSVQHFEIEEFDPEPISICMVTVNPITNTNKVIWEENNLDPAVKNIRIYRETSQSGVYIPAGMVHVDSLSEFVDTQSDPTLRAWRYKIAAVDSCGNESTLSTFHKTLHLTINVGVGGETNLIWDGYIGFSFSSYNIWRYSEVGGVDTLEQLVTLPNNLVSYTDNTVPQNATELAYYVEAVPDNSCTSTRANHNVTRSNRSAPINGGGGLDETVDINETPSQTMTLFPNPATDQLTIGIPGNIGNINISIVDVAGKLVFHTTTNQEMLQLDMTPLERGLYQIIAHGNNTYLVDRVVLVK